MYRKWPLMVGGALIIVGGLLTLDNFNLIRFDLWDSLGRLWPVVLIAVGIWLIYRRSYNSVGDCNTSDSGKVSRLAGQIKSKPDCIDERGLDIQLGVGKIDLDLTSTDLREGVNKIEAAVGIGEVEVKLPGEVACSIAGACGIGNVHLLAESSDGFSPRLSRTDPDYETAPKKIKLEARSGLGEVRILRAQ